jgi:hypothetical protein
MPSSFVDSRINQNLEVATEYFRALVSKKTTNTLNKANKSAGSIGFIPYNVSFTMDGISGIKIYNELSLDTNFLPPGYSEVTNFIVTGVDHKIQNGDWETNINVTLIPRTDPIDNIITSSLTILGQIEVAPVIPPTTSTVSLSGPGLDPVKSLILSVESGGDYEIYNYGPDGGTGIRSITPGSKYYSTSATKLTDKTVSWINTQFQRVGYGTTGAACNPGSPGSAFAVGKYQTIPCTLKGAITALGIGGQPFDAATQEKIGDWLVLTKRPRLGAYLKGANSGTQTDLENAVQDLGLEFASLPIITKGGITWGNVATGTGNKGNYGGSGINPDTVSTTVGTVVKALIKSRINYSGNNPSFIPTYYV